MTFLLSCFSIGILNALYDKYLIDKNRYIKHGLHTVGASAICLALLWILTFKGTYTISEASALIPLSIALRWIYHDLLLNLFRGKSLDYLGDNANTDKYLSRFDNQYIPKSLALFISLVIYLIPQYL